MSYLLNQLNYVFIFYKYQNIKFEEKNIIKFFKLNLKFFYIFIKQELYWAL